MRYTECRLTPIAELLLRDRPGHRWIFAPTTTAPSRSPNCLPARLPFVLLNGASGIAVGMATEIPSHNLREVAAAAIHAIEHPAGQRGRSAHPSAALTTRRRPDHLARRRHPPGL